MTETENVDRDKHKKGRKMKNNEQDNEIAGNVRQNATTLYSRDWKKEVEA